jgi:hypothetical protein
MSVMVELGGVMGDGRVQFGRRMGEDRPLLEAVPGQDGPPKSSRGRGREAAAPDGHESQQDIPGQFHGIASLVPGRYGAV